VRVKEKPASDRDTPDSFDPTPQAFPLGGPASGAAGAGGGSAASRESPSTRGDSRDPNHLLRAEEKNAYDSDTDGAKSDNTRGNRHGPGSGGAGSSDRRRPSSAAAAASGGGAVSGNQLLRRSHSPIGPAPGKGHHNSNSRLATTPVRRAQNSRGSAAGAAAAAAAVGSGQGTRAAEGRGGGVEAPMTWDDGDEDETADGSSGGEGQGGDEEWLSRSLGGGAGSAEVAEMHKTVGK